MRHAFNLAFNFEPANKTLFYDEYQRVNSYFDNSELKATGLPQGRELEILNEVRDQVPPEVFTTEWKNPVNAGADEDGRKNLARRPSCSPRRASAEGRRARPTPPASSSRWSSSTASPTSSASSCPT